MKASLLVLSLLVCVVAGQIIPNEYLIKFRDNTSTNVTKAHFNHEALKEMKVHSHWNFHHFSGYHASIPDGHSALRFLRDLPEVEIVEPNQKVHKSVECLSQPTDKGLWGLSRISSEVIQPDGPYVYNSMSGKGVNAYVIDTGIYIENEDFEGRAVWGNNFIGGKNTDENGHGTHCAGTIGGKTYGVAKQATLIAVKVLDKSGSGTLSAVINGINWVATDYVKNNKKSSTANLSLGASYSAAVNSAVDNLVLAGVFVAVAAGNENQDACKVSPASAVQSVSVGATSSSDLRAYFSNWGRCVDIMAPGVDIKSDWIGNPDATLTISGTSMASPHVAGVASSVMSVFPELSAAQVKDYIIEHGNKIAIGDLRGSPDLLLYQGCLSA